MFRFLCELRNPYIVGRPTMVIMLTHAMMGSLRDTKVRGQFAEIKADGSFALNHSDNAEHTLLSPARRDLLTFMRMFRGGSCAGVRVR